MQDHMLSSEGRQKLTETWPQALQELSASGENAYYPRTHQGVQIVGTNRCHGRMRGGRNDVYCRDWTSCTVKELQ